MFREDYHTENGDARSVKNFHLSLKELATHVRLIYRRNSPAPFPPLFPLLAENLLCKPPPLFTSAPLLRELKARARDIIIVSGH
eukprot:7009608-Pyramimonas_sp.AAC.1